VKKNAGLVAVAVGFFCVFCGVVGVLFLLLQMFRARDVLCRGSGFGSFACRFCGALLWFLCDM